MRVRVAGLAGLWLAMACSALGCASLSRSSGNAGHPVLSVVKSAPATVRGRHFRSHERVRVTAGAKAIQVTAGGNGTFVVTIRGATRCDLVRVVAKGSAGSYTVLKTLPPPMCIAARSG